MRKIEDERVKIVQTGTSPLTPKELADAWESTVDTTKINRGRTNSNINGTIGVTLNLHRQDNTEEVELEARREPGAKVTKITVSSVLPKLEEDSD